MSTTIEQHTIDQIPADEREGRGRELFTIWFGINMTPLTVVTGAVGTAAIGLPFWAAVLAIAVGNVVGGLLMALHSAQGPRLGVPQMLQARGQFGASGAALVVVLAIVMYMGYFASNLVVSAQALRQALGGLSVDTGIVLCAAVSLGISVVGYRLVQRATAVSAPLVGALVLIGLVAIFAGGRVPSGALTSGDVTTAGFFSMLAIAIVWQVAYVPYVSDYSRYMPEETGGRGAFWGSYLGCVSSTVLLMSLGALVGVASADADAMVGLDALVGGLGTVILLGFAFAAAVSNSVNAYCSVLCSLTLIETFRRGWRPGVRARLQTTVVLHAVGLAIGLAGQGDFLGNYSNFITLLLYALVPWSAINLVDYYLLRRGRYVVSEFFERDGGRYGRWNVRALGVYALGVAVEVPFMVTSMYTGPIADHLGGVDVAWLVGFVVASVAYWSIGRGRAEPAPGPDLAEVAR